MNPLWLIPGCVAAAAVVTAVVALALRDRSDNVYWGAALLLTLVLAGTFYVLNRDTPLPFEPQSPPRDLALDCRCLAVVFVVAPTLFTFGIGRLVLPQTGKGLRPRWRFPALLLAVPIVMLLYAFGACAALIATLWLGAW